MALELHCGLLPFFLSIDMGHRHIVAELTHIVHSGAFSYRIEPSAWYTGRRSTEVVWAVEVYLYVADWLVLWWTGPYREAA
jgi:hypothetical protein